MGCPVIDTNSTTGEGLTELVKAAIALNGQNPKAPYDQDDVDLNSKAAVEMADRKQFEFVNGIVAKVETRKILTKNKNFQDKIDAVLTHPVAGLPIFALVMFLVFHISQSEGKLGLAYPLENKHIGQVKKQLL